MISLQNKTKVDNSCHIVLASKSALLLLLFGFILGAFCQPKSPYQMPHYTDTVSSVLYIGGQMFDPDDRSTKILPII